MLDAAIIGGGAAGFFAAINIKEKHPNWKIQIFEKSPTCLGKVKISGGGRCNVTHHCFDPNTLVNYYPRGSRELLSVFNRFNPKHTIDWFRERNVILKAEFDGRMFPISDDSQTIVKCFLDACSNLDIKINTRSAVSKISKSSDYFEFVTDSDVFHCKNLIICTGSSEHFWNILKSLGHSVINPVPSLFTFNSKDPLITDLMGLSLPLVQVKLSLNKEDLKANGIKEKSVIQQGPLLITHWGLSGPAILKLSSVCARVLHQLNYHFDIQLNFNSLTTDETFKILTEAKQTHLKKQITNTPLFEFPSRFWDRLIDISIGKK
ncbi:MAG: aminoacetone oxidase family FAD-binding enzyme, partial [Bacteroidia bacterium]|nr:aminoacetone oxidase family FAD-binding enzyme [Bacteroidia bacterium]